MDVPSSAASLVRKWRRVVPSLDEPVRVGYLRAELHGAALPDAAAALDRVCGEAEQADPPAVEVLLALVDLLNEVDFEPLAQTLREEAAGTGLLALGRILRRPTRARGPAQAIALVPDYGGGRTLTLGERRALARRPTRAAFDKLLADPHPMVIAALLANPKIVEDDVVRLAAKRPTISDVLVEIAKCRRWAHRVRVRMSLVQNPYTPPEIAIPLVGLLTRPQLKQVAEAADIQPSVRAAALDLLARRPPVRRTSRRTAMQ